uniref:von Hippel-Lindau disease tumour suppressor beta domain-containing protein n=1 Tax=Strigamia maritima TaxID=126957 RepID=T1J7I0_STRMM
MSKENENGELKSGSDRLKAFVRFLNKTNRDVDVIWLNYEGQRTLHPEQFLDVNTYVTHPWIFRDSSSRAKLLGSREEIYQPQFWLNTMPMVERSNNAQLKPKRTIVYITLPVYTLKVRCLEVVRKYLNKLEDAETLCIPRTLKAELLQQCV